MVTYASAPSRSTASLTISFGLVTVPVQLFTGIEESRIKRNRFSPEGNPVKQLNVDMETGEKLEHEDFVMRYRLDADTTVELRDDEIEAIAENPGGAAEVVAFLPNSLLSSYQQESLYQVRPAQTRDRHSAAIDNAFGLLMWAMENDHVFALVRFAVRGKPRVGALTSDGWLHVVAWTDEVREPLPFPAVELDEQEMELASTLVRALTREEFVEVPDEISAAVREYAEVKARGETPKVKEAPSKGAADLMAALKASVEAVEAKGNGKKRKKVATRG